MGFDSRNSLIKELWYAKENNDSEYVQQVRESIVAWDLGDRYDLTYPDELDSLREAENGLEAIGICYLMARFCVEQGFEDDIDAVMNNLSDERRNLKGGSRWDLLDDYLITKGLEETFGGVVLNGDVALAEIWMDDKICAYVKLN